MKKLSSQLTAGKKANVLVFDLFVLMLATWIALFVRLGYSDVSFLSEIDFWVSAGILIVFQYIFGTYHLDLPESSSRVFLKLTVSVFTATVFVIFVSYLLGKDRTGIFGRGILLGSLIFYGFISTGYRLLIHRLFQKAQQKLEWLFVISKDICVQFQEELKRNPIPGRFSFLTQESYSGPQIIGQWKDLDAALDKQWAGVVIATDPAEIPDFMSRLLMNARFSGHNIIDLCDFYEVYWKKVPVYFLRPHWFVRIDGFVIFTHPISLRIKRLVDLFLAVLLLLLAWPVMLVTAMVVILESPGGALYRQIRTGKDGHEFTIYKFRSMRIDAEKEGAQWATVNDARVTRVGNFIRLTRLDELPQLVNVLKGEMSFVGPRPERPHFNRMLEKEIPFYDLRHMVCPGLTGWAQVLYPYGSSVEDAKEKLQFELYYIKNHSLWLDIVIVFKTIAVVVLGRGR